MTKDKTQIEKMVQRNTETVKEIVDGLVKTIQDLKDENERLAIELKWARDQKPKFKTLEWTDIDSTPSTTTKY